MYRSLAAVAASVIAATTLFGAPAEACISCEYVPEVLHASKEPRAPRVKVYEKKQRVIVARPSAPRVSKPSPAKSRVARAEPAESRKVAASKPAKSDTTKSAKSTKSTETNETTETSGAAASGTAALSKPVTAETTADTASTEASPAAAGQGAEDTTVADAGCKKFVPALGASVTVPCE